jgi:Dyp-type peroxidase family
MPTKSSSKKQRRDSKESGRPTAFPSKSSKPPSATDEDEVNLSPFRTSKEPVREAPAPEPLHCGLDDPSHPCVCDEPVLRTDNIQGNILGGFMKDFQAFLFFTIAPGKIKPFKDWLAAMQPFIATTAEVISFNRLFKEIRGRRKREPTMLKVTWINIAFSFKGIQKLANGTDLDTDFEDEAFTDGLTKRSKDGILGDPSRNNQTSAEGHPANWVIGGTTDNVDVVILIASDEEAELDEANTNSTVSQILNGSTAFPGGVKNFAQGNVKVQHGENLPADKKLAGHEHFGFLDGVSQPGVRGRLSSDQHDVLTPRQNANNRDQGKPGQELIWPGEFVFGYPQGPSNPDDDPDPKKKFESPGPISTAGPDWADDGSFLVFRRLRQDVGLFHQFLKETATKLAVPTPPPLLTPPPPGVPVGDSAADVVGARCVGRWRSGAPIERTVHPNPKRPGDPLKNDQDNPFLAVDDCANNNFEFQDGTEPLPLSSLDNPFDCVDQIDPEDANNKPFQPAGKDEMGATCPFTGHIRKAYPRDDKPLPDSHGNLPPLMLDGHKVQDEEGNDIITNENNTQTHRLLRRGIPWGDASNSTPGNPSRDTRDNRPTSKALDKGRGLLFLAYQTSIVDQFEFVIQKWVNNPDFKEAKGPAPTAPPTLIPNPQDQGGGHDPIIGQNNIAGEHRVRDFTITFQDGTGARKTARVSTEDNTGNGRDWVIPTGGEYFFAPSIDALGKLSKT